MKKREENRGDFDNIYALVCLAFSKITDPRNYNSSYSLADMLKVGFAMFSLKSNSLLSFLGLTQSEEHNLSSIYKLSKLPSANGLRKSLDKLSVDELRPVFRQLWKRMTRLGIFHDYRYLQRNLIISIDGVEHFCSNKIHCPNCLSRKINKKIQYYHAMLSAVLVHPKQREVFVLDNEPIVMQDGNEKNDCERNAVKRLFDRLTEYYPKARFLFVMDALYSCGPVIEKIVSNVYWEYIIGIKPDSHKLLFARFETRTKTGQVTWIEKQDDKGAHRYGFTNNIPLNATHSHIRVNMIHYELVSKKGKKTTFTWISSIKLTYRNIERIVLAARSRWKIENETFNTLKNQGYQFEHSFGHGNEHLSSVFAFLMMMAFTVDQIQQHSCKLFRQLWTALKTKVKLWENLRAAFKILDFESMQKLFEHIAKINRIQLE